MKKSFIEGLVQTQHEFSRKELKGSAVMMLGGLVTIVGINTMLKGLETMVEANTVNGILSVIKESVEEAGGD